MKKMVKALCLFLVLGVLGTHRSHAQAEEIAQLLLNVEKLAQFKNILDDMKKGYEILNGGYKTVKDISEGNFSIHKTFLDGLMAVSPEVRNYRKVAGIVEKQIVLVQEYKKAFNRFRGADVFNAGELAYMERVYGNLFRQSLKGLDELAMIVTANKLRMSDEERLAAIDRIFDEMDERLMFLRHFNTETSSLTLQRKKEKLDIGKIRELHNTNK